MTVTWNPETLAAVDDAYDYDRSTDGVSCYDAYLRKYDYWFTGPERGGIDPDTTSAELASSAWTVATAPIMTPGYVRIRPDVHSITAIAGAEDPRRLVVTVTAPLPRPQQFGRPALMWRDWEPDPYSFGEEPYCALTPPAEQHDVLLITAQMRISISGRGLPVPSDYQRDVGAAARAAVAVIVRQVNSRLGRLDRDLTTAAPLPA